ncbi:MAG: RIP metalloprotease RseP [Sporomusaceae bacterium]|nr:RIP metalloprotease RseP [Sporomusaceae bacterium]
MSITIIATIFVFGLLVMVHELGHFLTAKLVGMGVHEFAIGFGPKIISKKYGETVYSLRLIPLGGFNKIAGMDPDEPQDEKSYLSKPVWARMLVIIAGSAMNLLLPVFLFTVVFLANGVDIPSNEPVMGTVMADRPASRANFQPGDRIKAVNGQNVTAWKDFVAVVQANAGHELHVVYERNGQTATAAITPEYDDAAKRGIIGVMPVIDHKQPGAAEAAGLAAKQTYLLAATMLTGIGQMITGQAPADVAGPIGVAQMAGQVAQMGFMPLLQFAAFLSINLGLINLLPVPVLDGGHVVTLAIEAVRRKPLSKESLQFVQMIGFSLLILLMLLATFKDLTRLKLF